MFEQLIAHYGYLAVLLGTFIEGEAVLLAAGAIAHKGLLSFSIMLCAATLGSVAWAQLWFQVGRSLGNRVFDTRPAWRGHTREIERFIRSYGGWFVLCFRFVSGMGTVAPALLGASGYPPRRYRLLDPIGAAIWATAFGSAGFGLDAGLGQLLGRPIRWDELVVAVIALGFALWLGARAVQYLAGRVPKRTPSRQT
jgi:membrane protein DedA with SNARE-associated domain